MLSDKGGLETAKQLLADRKAQTGLDKLWELGLLHESMEAVVLRDEFRSLFTETELAEAKKRLVDRGYYDN